MSDKKPTAEKAVEKKQYTFRDDFQVGTKKDGTPKKTYLKGKSYPLSVDEATYFESKHLI